MQIELSPDDIETIISEADSAALRSAIPTSLREPCQQIGFIPLQDIFLDLAEAVAGRLPVPVLGELLAQKQYPLECPEERYAGGKFPFQSDGTDTLAEWVKEDAPLMGQDVVTWFSAGFHHIPRMEDWPVMSTEWKTIHMMPHNFFATNPGMTIRKGQ